MIFNLTYPKRVNEVCNLKIEDIDFTLKKISFICSKVRKHYKQARMDILSERNNGSAFVV